MKSRELIILDIDGTLLKGQSQQILLNFLFKNKQIGLFYYLRIYYWFIMYKLGLNKNPKKVMEFAFRFLSGKNVEEVDSILELFVRKELSNHIFKEMIDIIEVHRKMNRKLLLLSNAIEPLIKKISEHLKINDYISTKLIHNNEIYTGKIDGNIMYGKEKLSAIIEFTKSKNYSLDDCWAYADHKSDIPLLKSVGHPHAVNPDKYLKRFALDNKWCIHNFI